MRALKAGVAYFAIVFGLGFVFGTARTLAMARFPNITRLDAVLLELPVILAMSWLICAMLIRRLAVREFYARAIMGAAAFALLMAAETALGTALGGETIAGHFALYREPAHALGLAGQVAFALLPLIAGGRLETSRIRRPG